MTPQELKNSILQLAIQSKLVEQRPEEGTAAELLEKIFAAKNAKDAKKNLTRSRRDAKSAKESRLASNVSRPVEDAPFDIPESWEWVRLGEMISLLSGRDLEPSNYSATPQKYPYMTGASNFVNGNLLVNRWTNHPVTVSHLGDLLITCKGTVGAMAFNAIGDIHIARQIMAISSGSIDLHYVKVFLAASVQSLKAAANSMIPGIDRKAMLLRPFPLPPLAEQKRIVAKIEELLPLIDRYEKAWSRLEDFNKRFPVDMQKSLLQLAIQGKLVEQRPEEGTGEELYRQIQAEKQRLVRSGKIKKEKPLPEITEDEIPFEIPDSWKWVRLSNVVDVRDGTHETPKYVSEGVPLVTSKNLVNGTIDFATAKHISHEDSEAINIRSGVDDGDILFAMIGTIGNPVLVRKDREFSIKNMALFKPIKSGLFYMEYLMQFLVKAQVDMRKSASASVQSFVSLSFLRNYLFPLPPLAEQKRIVAKLEEILPLCERLK